MYEALLAGGAILWFAALIIYARTGAASVYHPATYYLAFHGLVFVLRPIVAYAYDYRSIYRLYQFTADMDVKTTVLIAANLGFVCFMLAVLSVANRPLVLRPTAPTRGDSQRSSRLSLVVTALLLAPLGIASQLATVAGQEFNQDRIMDVGTGTFINTSANGYFLTAANLLGILAVLIAWQYRFRFWSLLPFVAFFGLRLTTGAARWTFVLTAAALCLFYLYDRRRQWPTVPTFLVGLIVLPVFYLLGQNRYLVMDFISGRPPRTDAFKEGPLEGMDFANLEYFEFLVNAIPGKTGTWGYFVNNLQILTEPIPRTLWPAKPVGAPIKMWELFDYGYPIGMTNSLPGEGWAQLGYFGVALWCGLAGLALGAFYNWFRRSRQSGFQVALFLLLTPLCVQFFRDGLLISALRFSMWFLIVVAVWKLLSLVIDARRRPAPKPRLLRRPPPPVSLPR